MTLIYSFTFCGLICLLGQIIENNTKLTPGHITSIFVVIGAFLSIFGIYDQLTNIIGTGTNLPIISFGNTLTNYAYLGYMQKGILGLFSNMLIGVSSGIVSAVTFSFILTIFFNPNY